MAYEHLGHMTLPNVAPHEYAHLVDRFPSDGDFFMRYYSKTREVKIIVNRGDSEVIASVNDGELTAPERDSASSLYARIGGCLEKFRLGRINS